MQEVQAQAVPAQAERISIATFIVRLKGEPELDAMAKSFRRDKAAAQQVFADWSADKPGLAGLMLESASYSGELIVGLPINDPAGRSPKDVIAAFEALDNLVYVELDAMARPGKGE